MAAHRRVTFDPCFLRPGGATAGSGWTVESMYVYFMPSTASVVAEMQGAAALLSLRLYIRLHITTYIDAPEAGVMYNIIVARRWCDVV